jgi:hypothetical protein
VRVGTKNVERFLDFLVDQAEKADEKRIQRAYEITLWGLTTITRAYVRSNMEKHCPPGVEFQKNPEQRPFLDILREGIDLYTAETGQSVYVDLPQEKIGTQEFAKQLNQREESGVNLYEKAKALIASGLTAAAVDLVSTQVPCLKKLFPLIDATEGISLANISHYYDDPSAGLFKEDYFVEGGPNISSSEFFRRALVLTHGEVIEALQIVYREFKFACRETPDPKVTSSQFSRHVKDEFSPFIPWDKLPEGNTPDPRKRSPEKMLNSLQIKGYGISGLRDTSIFYDFSLPNQVGKAYHAFNLAYLLSQFSPEVIAIMVAGEYFKHGEIQGTYKLLGDLEILGGLHQISRYFETLPTKNEWILTVATRALENLESLAEKPLAEWSETLAEVENIYEGDHSIIEDVAPLEQLMDKFIEVFEREGFLENAGNYYPVHLVGKIAKRAIYLSRDETKIDRLQEIENRAIAYLELPEQYQEIYEQDAGDNYEYEE